MPDTGAPYFIPYADPTDLVRDWPDLSEDVALAIVAALENIPVLEKRVAAFTGSGTWTVPAGVTYAVAHMLGGGGGTGQDASSPGDGGQSSVAFSGGTVVSNGGVRALTAGAGGNLVTYGHSALANTGAGASLAERQSPERNASATVAGSSNWVVAGASVTPAASISVVVGAGGAAGTGGGTGGSGYVWIEYYEEV
jgi:hypothetical protein